MKTTLRIVPAVMIFMGLLILTLSSNRDVRAASLYVDPVAGGDVGNCTNSAAPCSTIQYAINQAVAGDTINLAAGTYTNSGNQNLILTKALTFVGAGPATTILTPSAVSTPVFEIMTGNITLRDMTLTGVTGERWAVRLYKDGGTIDGVTFNNVHFTNNNTRGIEIHNNTLVTNLTITGSRFEGNQVGIRLAGGSGTDPSTSGGKLSGATISNTVFEGNTGYAIQQGSARDSNISGLTISGSTFTNNPIALSFGELRSSTIQNSTFTGNGMAIRYVDAGTAAAVNSGTVTISGNTFTDQTGAPLFVAVSANPLDGPVTISNNTFTQNVGLLSATTPMIEVALDSSQPHSTLTLSGNQVTLSGTLGPTMSVHGILVRGGVGQVNITNNTLNGGSIGTTGTPLASSGIALHTTDTTYGNMKPTVKAKLSGNTVSSWVNGISLYDSVAGVFGNVPNAASIVINRNALTGNSSFGARSDVPTAADATCNWWGAASGPSGNGPGTGDAVSTQLSHVPWLITSDLNASCVSISTFEVFTTPGKPGKTAGLQQDAGDILGYDQDTNTWGFLFDGSDVGLKRVIHGIAFDPFNCILLSFGSNQKIAGLGTAKPQDIVKFCPTSLGDTTAGTFSWYFDGSDVGLESTDERIDALDLLGDGRILISISTKFSLPGPGGTTLTGFDEDLIAFTPAVLGETTNGTWEVYLDGSTVPGLDKEDIIGVALDDPTGDLFISTYDNFSILGVAGTANDVLRLQPIGGGTYTAQLYFAGAPTGYTRRIQGMQIELQ